MVNNVHFVRSTLQLILLQLNFRANIKLNPNTVRKSPRIRKRLFQLNSRTNMKLNPNAVRRSARISERNQFVETREYGSNKRCRKKFISAINSNLEYTNDGGNEEVKKMNLSSFKRTIRKIRTQTNIPIYRIPEDKYKTALEVLNQTPPQKAQTWEMGCYGPIHLYGSRKCETRKNSLKLLLMEARTCLLNKDWKNLSLILTFAKPIDPHEYMYYFSTIIRYAIACLLSDPEARNGELLDRFMQGVLSIHDQAEMEKFLTILFKSESFVMVNC